MQPAGELVVEARGVGDVEAMESRGRRAKGRDVLAVGGGQRPVETRRRLGGSGGGILGWGRVGTASGEQGNSGEKHGRLHDNLRIGW